MRNYQVRNMLRDEMRVGDKAFFYHSNCTPPGIVGVMEIVKTGYPDASAWDKKSKYFDEKKSSRKASLVSGRCPFRSKIYKDDYT